VQQGRKQRNAQAPHSRRYIQVAPGNAGELGEKRQRAGKIFRLKSKECEVQAERERAEAELQLCQRENFPSTKAM